MLIYNILAILKIAYVQIFLFRIGGRIQFFTLVILVCLFVSICSTIYILLKGLCIDKVGVPQIIRRIFTMYIICSTYNGVFVNFLICCFPKFFFFVSWNERNCCCYILEFLSKRCFMICFHPVYFVVLVNFIVHFIIEQSIYLNV